MQSTSLNGEKCYLCICGRSYKHAGSLYTHQTYECGKSPQFSCVYCPSMYKHRHKLKEHLIIKHYVDDAVATNMTKKQNFEAKQDQTSILNEFI